MAGHLLNPLETIRRDQISEIGSGAGAVIDEETVPPVGGVDGRMGLIGVGGDDLHVAVFLEQGKGMALLPPRLQKAMREAVSLMSFGIREEHF